VGARTRMAVGLGRGREFSGCGEGGVGCLNANVTVADNC